MRRPLFGICAALLTFTLGYYSSLLRHVFRAGRPARARPSEPASQQCQVHNSALRVERVPVKYGMPVNAPARYEAERTLFPNSRHSIRGGCVVMEKKYAEVPVCAACRAAEAEWRRRHPREP